tara:strand:+ start:8398 stop:10341 length:1944 start_codon:yes stop_codon:yes gene_type:complete
VIRFPFFLTISVACAIGQEEVLEPLQTEKVRVHSEPKIFDKIRLQESPKLELDAILRESPSFNTYRRSSSSVAHPTSQGVSLRGTGTSAASRSIVLWDGIPLNDPFGGWVRWNRFSLVELDSARFGDHSSFASSAKAISLHSRRPTMDSIAELRLGVGDVHGFSTDAFFANKENPEGWTTRTSFRVEDFAGHKVVRDNQRGPIDEDAWSRMKTARVVVSRQSSIGLFSARLAGFDERRGNGTPLGRNQGNGWDWSLDLENEQSRTAIFGQERDFASVFPKVSADRSSESIALDQYHVPSQSLGFLHEYSWELAERELGFRLSAIQKNGHTHEENHFTKSLRKAGGRQTQIGSSLESSWLSEKNWLVDARFKADFFQDSQGIRSGWTATDERFSRKKEFELGGSLKLSKSISKALAFNSLLRSHVRQPTLNELYRPYRVGNFSVDANEKLTIERITGCEIGFDWQISQNLSTSFTLFQDNLRNSVANVSDPNDANDAQRINLNKARAKGIEIIIDQKLGENLSLTLGGLHLFTEVRDCPENPAIVGNRFAQVPRSRMNATLAWTQPIGGVRLDLSNESKRYDDARNSRLNDDFLVLDLSFIRKISASARIRFSLNNLTNEEIQTGLSTDDVVSTSVPRNFMLGFDWSF